MWKSQWIVERDDTRVAAQCPFHGGFLINKNNHRHPPENTYAISRLCLFHRRWKSERIVLILLILVSCLSYIVTWKCHKSRRTNTKGLFIFTFLNDLHVSNKFVILYSSSGTLWILMLLWSKFIKFMYLYKALGIYKFFTNQIIVNILDFFEKEIFLATSK